MTYVLKLPVKEQLKKNPLLVSAQNIHHKGPSVLLFSCVMHYHNYPSQLAYDRSIRLQNLTHFHTGFPNYDPGMMSIKVSRITSGIRSAV